MDLKMIRGDSKTFSTALTDAAGNAIDLTGATVWMTAKSAFTDLDADAVFQKSTGDGITHLDDASGLIQVVLDPEDTEDLDGTKHRLVYDIQVVDSGVVTTVVRAKLLVLPDVTISTAIS